MRVALVHPGWSFDGSIYFGCREAHLPLELGSTHALLARAGHEAAMFDGALDGLDLHALADAVADFRPDMTLVTTAPTYLFWRCAQPELRVPAAFLETLADRGGVTVAAGPHLWVFGDNVEDAMGHWRFLAFYILCGVAAALAHDVAQPRSVAPLVGASGAVAGVIAAYLMLHPNVKVWVLVLWRVPLRLKAAWVLGFWVVLQVFSILTAGPRDTVAWWAHIGGLAAGAVLVVVMRRPGVPLFDRGLVTAAPPSRR